MPTYNNLRPGDAAPWFSQRSFGNPNYVFDTAAGRHIVLCFYASASDPHALAAIEAAQSRRSFFDDKTACFFGVSLDSKDEAESASPIAIRATGISGTSTARSAASMARCRLKPSPAKTTWRFAAYGSCSTRRCASSR